MVSAQLATVGQLVIPPDQPTSRPSDQRLAAIVGPTASGKTAVAVALRRDFGLPIEAINCDALQVYQRLYAGTAKPSAQELAALPYHLLDCQPPETAMNAAQWAYLAQATIADIRSRGQWPVLVGGTGLYLRALLRGLAQIPPVDAAIRDDLALQWQQRGAVAMHRQLSEVDPTYAAQTPVNNRQRVMRALEVQLATGRAFSDFHCEHQQQPDHYACYVWQLRPEVQAMHQRIGARAHEMAAPLLAEVADLLEQGLSPAAPAMQALGYRQAALAAQHGIDADHFADVLAAAHRQYAKKQRTWFAAQRSDHTSTVLDPAEIEAVAAQLRRWFAP